MTYSHYTPHPKGPRTNMGRYGSMVDTRHDAKLSSSVYLVQINSQFTIWIQARGGGVVNSNPPMPARFVCFN